MKRVIKIFRDEWEKLICGAGALGTVIYIACLLLGIGSQEIEQRNAGLTREVPQIFGERAFAFMEQPPDAELAAYQPFRSDVEFSKREKSTLLEKITPEQTEEKTEPKQTSQKQEKSQESSKQKTAAKTSEPEQKQTEDDGKEKEDETEGKTQPDPTPLPPKKDDKVSRKIKYCGTMDLPSGVIALIRLEEEKKNFQVQENETFDDFKVLGYSEDQIEIQTPKANTVTIQFKETKTIKFTK